MRKKQPPVREQGFPPACAHLQGVRLVTLLPSLRPAVRKRSRCRLPALLSCRPHGDAWVSFCPLQVWLRGRGQQEPPQQRGPPSGRTTLPYPEERENHPNHRPRAAPPDRRPMTTGRIPQPDDPLRQPVPPHPWGVPQAVAPVPALWSDRLPPRMRAWLQQPSCGRARRMRLDAPRGKRLFALRQAGAAPHQAQRPPHQLHAEQRKIPLTVGPSVRQPRPREPARPRPQVQPSDCPHDDAGQMSFGEGWQVPVVPCPLSYPQTESAKKLPGARLWWRQRPAMHLPVGRRPPLPGPPCPAQAFFSACCPARGKTPSLPPAVPQGHPPMPFRPAVLPASPFSPSRPFFPSAPETAQDHRPPATRGPWP